MKQTLKSKLQIEAELSLRRYLMTEIGLTPPPWNSPSVHPSSWWTAEWKRWLALESLIGWVPLQEVPKFVKAWMRHHPEQPQ